MRLDGFLSTKVSSLPPKWMDLFEPPIPCTLPSLDYLLLVVT